MKRRKRIWRWDEFLYYWFHCSTRDLIVAKISKWDIICCNARMSYWISFQYLCQWSDCFFFPSETPMKPKKPMQVQDQLKPCQIGQVGAECFDEKYENNRISWMIWLFHASAAQRIAAWKIWNLRQHFEKSLCPTYFWGHWSRWKGNLSQGIHFLVKKVRSDGARCVQEFAQAVLLWGATM